MKNSFILHNSYFRKFRNLTLEQKGSLLEALFNYSIDKVPYSGDDPLVCLAFDVVRVDMDVNQEKYEQTCEKNKENILKRWNTTVYDRIQTNTNHTDIGYRIKDKGNRKEDNKIVSKDTSASTEVKGKSSSDINDLIGYLQDKLGCTLEGSSKTNRQYCWNLIRRIKKDYPDKPVVQAIKIIIDAGLEDGFHAKNITGYKYLFYNYQKIIRGRQRVSGDVVRIKL
jgi:hypothetical protein